MVTGQARPMQALHGNLAAADRVSSGAVMVHHLRILKGGHDSFG